MNKPKQSANFRSFWMGGFEAASHINRFRQRIDMIAGTQHDVMALTDYQLLKSQNIQSARDALRWHLVDRGTGTLDFSSFLPQLKAACATNTQVLWSLMHYGYPEDLDIFSPEFIRRFVRFSTEVARLIREHTDDVPYFTPVNEISFFSWAATRPGMSPFAEGRDDEFKRQMVRTTVEVCGELQALDARCRFVFPEPIIHVVAPRGREELAQAAKQYDESQFEAWDMIAGRLAPELGGREELLDIVGMNFYHSNQWEIEVGRLEWEKIPRDPRWLPLSLMTERVWKRYRRPLFIAETSHVGIGRAPWILEVAAEVEAALKNGVPIEGICLFPILDRYDWDDPNHWHNSGLWDFNVSHGTLVRKLNEPYGEALKQARKMLPSEREHLELGML